MSTLCAHALPTEQQTQTDKRQSRRFRCNLDIVCKLRSEPSSADLAVARIRNLSATGVCLVLDRPFEPRSFIHLELAHRWRHTVCHNSVRVVYVIRRCNGMYLVGGAFERPLTSEEAAELLPRNCEELETEQVGDAIVAKFPEYSRLNERAIQTVDEQLDAIAQEWGDRPVILDLQRVAGLNSSMIRQLVTFNRRLAQSGGRLALCSATPDVSNLLNKTRLNTVLSVYSTEKDALEAS